LSRRGQLGALGDEPAAVEPDRRAARDVDAGIAGELVVAIVDRAFEGGAVEAIRRVDAAARVGDGPAEHGRGRACGEGVDEALLDRRGGGRSGVRSHGAAVDGAGRGGGAAGVGDRGGRGRAAGGEEEKRKEAHGDGYARAGARLYATSVRERHRGSDTVGV